MRSKSIDTKKIAFEIISVFEDKLESLNIYLPDKMRENREDEACVFGETYCEFKEAIIEILRKYKEEIK